MLLSPYMQIFGYSPIKIYILCWHNCEAEEKDQRKPLKPLSPKCDIVHHLIKMISVFGIIKTIPLQLYKGYLTLKHIFFPMIQEWMHA